MEKTFSEYKNKKFFYYFSCIFIVFGTIYLSGCTGSKPEDPAIARARDSLNVYSQMGSAFNEYKSSLDYNEKDDHTNAKKSFEESLQLLKKVDYRILEDSNNVQWRKDYENLLVSIAQDYLYTQKNIPDNSIVFKLAKKYGVKYEKITINSVTGNDVEPLPDGSEVPLVRNSVVDEYIDFFTKTDRGKNFIDKTMYRSGKYFSLMRKILRYHKTPEEMIYLSVQESGLNPTIVSKAGAVGLWQFMPATGKAYGLYQDGYRDDRRDVEKSTDAAARHLKDLYKSFGDWYLAWAAYNAGPGRVNSAISKSGSKDFWSLRSYLPGETKNYVPSILALSFVYRNPENYGFKDIELAKPLAFDRVNIDGELSLQKVAEYSESDIESIRELNSELTNDVVPDYDVPYQLRIPQGTYKTFIANYKKSPDFRSTGYEPEFAGNESSSYYTSEISVTTYEIENYNPGDQIHLSSNTNKTKLSYTYKDKEKLKDIADSFKVRESDLRRWNYISYGSNPKPNQVLTIYLTQKQYNEFYGIKEEVKDDDIEEVKDDGNGDVEVRTDYGKKIKISNDSEYKKESDTKTKNDENVKKKKEDNNKKEKKTPTEKLQYYNVTEGDNLSEIAETYGVSTSDLREWNDIEGDKIIIGQKLKIYSNKKVTDKKDKNSKNNSFHIVEEGEYLSGIAKDYDVSVNDLKEWNNLDDDVIKVGQKLIIVEPKNTKDKTSSKKTKTHKVKEGENLTEIADKYNISVDEIKEWNNIKKDVIIPGQELIVSKPSSKNKKDTSEKVEKSKTYKVKKGDTLASISEEFDVSIKDLKKWNDIENDGTIYVGQVLKLSDDSKNTKTKTTDQKKRKKKTN